MNSGNRQIFGGAAISYILIVVNALYAIVATPYIVSQIGDASFGVYKTITAFASSLMIIDLGLGATVQRYIANYRAYNKTSSIGNFVSMSLIEAAFLAILSSIVIIIIYINLSTLFRQGFTTDEIHLAKRLFVVIGLTVVFHLFENVMNGVLTGYGEFIVSNGLRLLRVVLRILCTFIFLFIWKSPLILVIIDCVLVILLLLFEVLYSIYRLYIKIVFVRFDSAIFKESFIYSIMMFITALANQMNGNLDNIVIGVFMSSTDVAIYSIAIIIFGMFEQIASAISGLLLPKLSFVIKDNYSSAANYVISIGRIQFILIGAVYGAFIVLGKIFINIWMGNDYLPAYYVAIILMGPSILELCMNVCLTILRVTNKLKFKTIVTVLMTLVNAVLTVVFVKHWGYYMAALSTAFTYIIGSVLLMNIYYHREFGFNIIYIYKSIFSRTLLCVIFSMLLTFLMMKLFYNDVSAFIIGAIVFVISYVSGIYIYGLTDEEKVSLKQYIRK